MGVADRLQEWLAAPKIVPEERNKVGVLRFSYIRFVDTYFLKKSPSEQSVYQHLASEYNFRKVSLSHTAENASHMASICTGE